MAGKGWGPKRRKKVKKKEAAANVKKLKRNNLYRNLTRFLSSYHYFYFYGIFDVKIVFQNTRRIKSFFPYKDKLAPSLRSKVVYRANCWDCNDFYIGKTKRRLRDRKTEHFKALTTNCLIMLWDHFEILATGRSDMHCKIKESLLTRDLKPALYQNVGSERLHLYY